MVFAVSMNSIRWWCSLSSGYMIVILKLINNTITNTLSSSHDYHLHHHYHHDHCRWILMIKWPSTKRWSNKPSPSPKVGNYMRCFQSRKQVMWQLIWYSLAGIQATLNARTSILGKRWWLVNVMLMLLPQIMTSYCMMIILWSAPLSIITILLSLLLLLYM